MHGSISEVGYVVSRASPKSMKPGLPVYKGAAAFSIVSCENTGFSATIPPLVGLFTDELICLVLERENINYHLSYKLMAPLKGQSVPEHIIFLLNAAIKLFNARRDKVDASLTAT